MQTHVLDSEFQIEKYQSADASRWDDFVMNYAVNGTFLQTRRFLDYHPEGKFHDSSYLIYDKKGRLIAVCLACETIEEGRKILNSHAGTTYGGIMIDSKIYKAKKVLELIQVLEKQWQKERYQKILLRQTSDILSKESGDLLQYCFGRHGFHCYNELNLYVDFAQYNKDILKEFDRGKRRNIYDCQKENLYCRRLETYDEIKKMYALLCATLEKYKRLPVHTADEIYNFQFERLAEECECYGVFCESEMVAASMMFYFHNAGVAHTQYLCADSRYEHISPMSYLYYAMLVEMRKKDFKKVSWGIVTENMGVYLNEGLARSKEAYGSKYCLNQIFVKEY